MYYNYNNLLNQNTTFNFIINKRGFGKAYAILKKKFYLK